MDDGASRNSRFKVTGCQAHVRFKYNIKVKKYIMKLIELKHNHPLIDEENKDLLRNRRLLDFTDMKFLHKVSASKVGTTRAQRLRTHMRGGYRNAKGRIIDWKNLKRNYLKTVGPIDAQLIIDKLNNRQQFTSNFSYEFEQTGRKLSSLFWADETAKLNYLEFGDVISFDSTFRTSKYNMVFVPFTGIDNHLKSVTFGAGLLSSETMPSYRWLLESFLKAHKKQPKLVLSDQDPALGQAISIVFTESRHRLCMWHIMNKVTNKFTYEQMNKVTNKIGYPILNTTDFRERLNKLVWDDKIDPTDFEEQWDVLLFDFRLEDHAWLNAMYEIRTQWISSYFKGVPMSGLMKTTSRSENANSFFNTFLKEGDTFMCFFQCYESAMEKQRYIQRTNDHDSKTMMPVLQTPSPLELHASKVYTDAVFRKVQKRICRAAWNCSVKMTVVEEHCHQITMDERDDNFNVKGRFKVIVNTMSGEVVCTCNYFIHKGYLCPHMARGLMDCGIRQIPKQYILRRWRKDLIHPGVLRQLSRDVDEEVERTTTAAYTIVDDCMNVLGSDQRAMKVFIEELEKVKRKITGDGEHQHTRSQEEMILALVGVPRPESIDIDVPDGVRNKGTGRGNRRVGTVEKVAGKNRRQCKSCNKYGHNSRTCPKSIRKNAGD